MKASPCAPAITAHTRSCSSTASPRHCARRSPSTIRPRKSTPWSRPLPACVSCWPDRPMNSSVETFRDATPDDADAIIDLVQSAYRGDASRRGWTTEADLLDGQRIDRPVLLDLLGRERTRVL